MGPLLRSALQNKETLCVYGLENRRSYRSQYSFVLLSPDSADDDKYTELIKLFPKPEEIKENYCNT